jgi:hypothetical protein
VTGAGTLALEPELAVPEPVVSDDVEPEPLVSVEVALEFGLAALAVDVPEVAVPVVPAATAPGRERAGSCPDASWMKITDQAATNTVATIATVRRRISDVRRLRAWSRWATVRWPAERWGDGESGVEDGGVILCLSRADDISCCIRLRSRVAAV